jgi:hypothetical protein
VDLPEFQIGDDSDPARRRQREAERSPQRFELAKSAAFFPALSVAIFLEAPALVAFITDPDEESQELDGDGRLLGTAEKAASSG